MNDNSASYTHFEAPDIDENAPRSGLFTRFWSKKKADEEKSLSTPIAVSVKPEPQQSLHISPNLEASESVRQSLVPSECGIGGISMDLPDQEAHSLSGSSELEAITTRPNKYALMNIVENVRKMLTDASGGASLKSSLLVSRNQQEMKRYWMPDANCKECYECGQAFNTLRRKHHCRICGQIFCHRCSNQMIPGKLLGCVGQQRACAYCATTVLRCAQVTVNGPPGVRPEDYSRLMADSGGANLRSSPSISGKAGRDSRSLIIGSDMQTSLPGGETDLPREGEQSSLRIRRGSSYPDLANDTLSSGPNIAFNFDDNTLTWNSASPRLTTLFPLSSSSSAGTGNLTGLTAQQDSTETGRGRAKAMVAASWEQDHLAKTGEQIRAIWLEVINQDRGVATNPFRSGLRLYKRCVGGSRLVHWIVAHNKVDGRDQARLLCQTFMDLRLLLPINKSDEGFFKDDCTMYTVRELNENQVSHFPQGAEESDAETEPAWLRQIVMDKRVLRGCSILPVDGSSDEDQHQLSQMLETSEVQTEGRSTFFVEKLNNTIRSKRAQVPFLRTDSVGPGVDAIIKQHNSKVIKITQFEDEKVSMPDSSGETVQDEEDVAFGQQYKRAIREYLQKVVRQEVMEEHLPVHWADIILDLARKVTEVVRPDVKNDHDQMDIRHYVKIKKLPDLNSTESEIFYGVCCSKNVAHKKMNSRVRTPKILLLASSIEFQRNENKLASLEPKIMQEEDYLRNCIDKILTLKPDILVVERTVSQLAQKLLLSEGITLVYNVKKSVMEGVSRMTQADLVPSVDALVSSSNTRLGCCNNFQIQTFNLLNGKKKSLLFMEAFAIHYGCTVILRGGPLSQLKQAKHVLGFILLAYHNARREVAYAINCSLRSSVPGATSTELATCVSETQGNQAAANQNVQLSDAVSVNDQSDPLQRRLTRANTYEHTLTLQEMMLGRHLSISHSCAVHPPYLDGMGVPTEGEDNCDEGLLKHFRHLVDYNLKKRLNGVMKKKMKVVEAELYETSKERGHTPSGLIRAGQLHPFQSNALTANQLSTEEEASYLDFRRTGGALRYEKGHEVRARLPIVCKRPPTEAEEEAKRSEEMKKSWLQWNPLDIRSHQKLSLIYTSYSYNHFSHEPCISPYIVSMHFYGQMDIPLGQFLVSHCFNTQYLCTTPSCGLPMLEHVRRFVHGSGALHLVMRRLEKEVPNFPGEIVMWSWCQICRKVSRPTPMSSDTWHLSFAKFLDIHFNSDAAQTFCRTRGEGPTCLHSLHHNHYQYFGYKTTVASFKYSPVTLYEVIVPPREIFITEPKRGDPIPEDLISEAKFVVEKYFHIYRDIKNYIFDQEQKATSEELKDILKAHRDILTEKERDLIRDKVDQIHLLLADDTEESENPGQPSIATPDSSSDVTPAERLLLLQERIVEVRRRIVDFVHDWDAKLTRYHDHEKVIEKHSRDQRKKNTTQRLNNTSSVTPPPTTTVSSTATTTTRPAGISARPVVTTTKELSFSTKLPSRPSHFSAADFSGGKEDGGSKPSTDDDVKVGQHRRSLSCPSSCFTDLQHDDCAVFDVSVDTPVKNTIDNQSLVVPNQQDRYSRIMSSSSDHESCSYAVSAGIEAAIGGGTHASASSKTTTADGSYLICEYQDFNQAEDTSSTPVLKFPSTSSGQLEASGKSFSNPDLTSTSTSAFLETSPVVLEHSGSASATPQHQQSTTTPASLSKPLTPLSSIVNSNKLSPSVQQSPATNRKSVLDQVDGSSAKGPSVVRKIIHNLTSQRSLKYLEEPFSLHEHHTLPPTLVTPVHVNDEELASIIAYALSSHDYDTKVREIEAARKLAQNNPDNSLVQSGEVLSTNRALRVSAAPVSSTSTTNGQPASTVRPRTRILADGGATAIHYTPGMDDELAATRSDESPSPTIDTESVNHPTASASAAATSAASKGGKTSDVDKSHVVLQFSDETTKFYCKVYYACEFSALRQLINPQGERTFIRSLSRSFAWAAKGGKSGSSFMKTRDDRYVIKEISSIELKTFLEISTHYFRHMTSIHQNQNLSVLAKILGVYQIAFQNSYYGAERRMDVVILENLFYGRQVRPIFDLKGSRRNRFITSRTGGDGGGTGGGAGGGSSGDDEVLQDENLLRLSQDSPLYIRWHSKEALRAALQIDTEFLTQLLIMDYSLLVGVDEHSHELVVGVIDYMRKFTFDKKLEMYFKTAMGGEGAQPTIVRPITYRQRFLEQMERYFLLVPDQWYDILDHPMEE